MLVIKAISQISGVGSGRIRSKRLSGNLSLTLANFQNAMNYILGILDSLGSLKSAEIVANLDSRK